MAILMSNGHHKVYCRMHADPKVVENVQKKGHKYRALSWALWSRSGLLAVPVEHSALSPNLLLKLDHTIDQSFGSRRAARDINVDGDNSVTATHDSLHKGMKMASYELA